ncbi:MAG TPA: hypothetical protein VI410_04215 [Anaerolineales bacterium]|jgi:hypothetical protein|nr:hypothetical protein [Anaerolineales bacterium]
MSPDRVVIEEVQARGDSDESTEAGSLPEATRAPSGPSRTPYTWLRRKKSSGSRISSGSPLYTRVLPIMILAMGVLTVALILFAAGVILGIVPFR